MKYARRAGTPELLAHLALGRVEGFPFKDEEVRQLKEELVEDQRPGAGSNYGRAMKEKSTVDEHTFTHSRRFRSPQANPNCIV